MEAVNELNWILIQSNIPWRIIVTESTLVVATDRYTRLNVIKRETFNLILFAGSHYVRYTKLIEYWWWWDGTAQCDAIIQGWKQAKKNICLISVY